MSNGARIALPQMALRKTTNIPSQLKIRKTIIVFPLALSSRLKPQFIGRSDRAKKDRQDKTKIRMKAPSQLQLRCAAEKSPLPFGEQGRDVAGEVFGRQR